MESSAANQSLCHMSFVCRNKQKVQLYRYNFLTFQENIERKGKIMKDEKKYEGTMDKSS